MAGVSGSGLSCGAMSGSDRPLVTGQPAAASGWRPAGELADGASALLTVGWADLQISVSRPVPELGLVRILIMLMGNMFTWLRHSGIEQDIVNKDCYMCMYWLPYRTDCKAICV
jgi:hypothetical protein